MRASRLTNQTDRHGPREQEPGNGWELLDDGPHGGGWLGAPRQPAEDPSGGLVAFQDEEPGSAPGWHLYREHRDEPEPWTEYLGRIQDGPAGLTVTARPEPEPHAERPSPSPTAQPGPGAQPGATVPQGEHGEDGEAARSRADSGRRRAPGHATRRKGDAAQTQAEVNRQARRLRNPSSAPFPVDFSGSENSPVSVQEIGGGSFLDENRGITCRHVPGTWPYRCQTCGKDSPAVRHWLELEEVPGGHGWGMVPTGTGSFRVVCPGCAR